MKALLLCAGYATRLYPLTKTTPKPLLEVAGGPLINHIVKKVEELDDVDEISIITNDKFFFHFLQWAKNTSSSKKITVVNDGTTSNEDRLGALGDIDYYLHNKNVQDDLLIIAGDNLFDMRLAHMNTLFKKTEKTVIALFDVQDKELASHYGVVEIDENSKLVHFEEKPLEPRSTLVSTGIYMIPKNDITLLKTYIEDGHSKDKLGSFFEWLHQKEDVFCHVTTDRWYDIGTPEQLKVADVEYRDE